MLLRIKGFFGKLLDPFGPIGNLLSPSVVYKERQGLPLQVAGTIRAQAPTTTANIEQGLQIERVLSSEADIPISRSRVISAFVEERYTPIYDIPVNSTDLAAIAFAAQHPRIVGWRVTQHARKEATAKAPMTAEEFVEHVQSIQFPAMSDEQYNIYLDTVKGNDPCIVDGQVLRGQPTFDATGKMTHDGIIRGGTQVRGGRADYRRKTKGYAHVDKGFWKKHVEAQAELDSRPVRNVKRALESFKNELPMWRPTGINPKKDRRSAV